ncbi:MAG: alpha-2-macroglobulin [Armatimonadota bacterium]
MASPSVRCSGVRIALVGILLAASVAERRGPSAQPEGDEAKRRAHAPNLTVEVHKRAFVVGQKAYVRVSLYNLRAATVAAYRVDLEELIPNATTVSISDPKDERGLPYRLKHLDLSRRRPSRTWAVRLKRTYPDSWRSHDAEVPKLAPGVYVISARGGGVEQRTWLAITSRALVAKRSPDKVFGWLIEAESGRPIQGVRLAVYDENGRTGVVTTERDGRFRFVPKAAIGHYWLATLSGPPAFVRPSAPRKPSLYKAYVYTDRPIYRPAHKVRFRGTVRTAQRGRYSLPRALASVNVKIRTDGGSTVYDEDLQLNEWGTFTGEFQLAPEPPLGQYELVTTVGQDEEEERFYARFEVEAYRKPEFEVQVDIPEKHYLSGDPIPVTISASYYFGSPVAGGKVSYNVRFREMGRRIPTKVLTAAGLGTAASVSIEDGFSGQGRLDQNGELSFEVQTRYAPLDRQMTVDATVTELALRPREGRGSTTITAALYRLSIRPESRRYVVGDTATILVDTKDYQGNPVSDEVEVSLIESKRDREGRYYEQKHTRKVRTDQDGSARVAYQMERPGRYRVEAWATDAEGNAVYADTSLWIAEEEEERRWPALRLASDKDAYQPGEVARVHGETNMLGSWMLVTIEGEFLYDAVVHRVLANEFDLRIPIKENYKPAVYVSATIVRRGDRTGARARLNVPHDENRLEVIVAPDRETYQPGQTTTYAITTRDHLGRGVPAEVGLGVVDQALYAIRKDRTPSPFEVFWGPRASLVTTDFSLAELYPGGAYQAAVGVPVARAPGPPPEAEEPPEQIRVRRRFLDVAYWNPSILTGPDGSADVSFELPDNLTTWRATARALTQEAAGGEGRETATVTLPLLVRLVLPRFYVESDEATAAAIVHNYTEADREVKVTLTAEGAEVLDEAQQTVTLAQEQSKRLTWRVRAVGPDSARFLVSADGGAGAADAMESTLRVVPNGVKNVLAYAGVSDDQVTQTIELPQNAVAGSARLEVAISPSLAGPIFEALEYLERYPYGCAEQTLDSFLPNVVVARTLARLEVDRPKPPNLDRYVSFGLQKLLRYQHDDGGWHWWEFDDSDPYISAYIVYGLKIAHEAGYVGALNAMRRGTEYLHDALQQEEHREARAYLLWALAYADQWRAESFQVALETALALFQDRQKLDVFSRASLALALSRLSAAEGAGNVAPRLTQAAATLAEELDGAAVQTGLGSHWTAGARHAYSWLDNDIEVTAQVLRVLLELKPDSANLVPAVRWLMAARAGKSWRSTKDTAAAVLALTNYLERAEELRPEYTARAFVGDTQIGQAQMSAQSVFADPVAFEVPAGGLPAGQNQLRIEKDGPGTIYWSARLHYLVPAEQALPLARGIAVKRTYRVPVEDPIAAGEQPSGAAVQVELRVLAEENMRYVLLEEPIPAGCEVVAGDDRPYGEAWDRREVWDNRVVFFFDYLPKGEHFVEYVLRTEAPGQYNILPSMATLMYFPEVRGHNKLVRMRIRELPEEGE